MNESDNSWQASALQELSSLTFFDKDDDSHIIHFNTEAGRRKTQDSWRSSSPPRGRGGHMAENSGSFPEKPLHSGTNGALDNKDLESGIDSLTEKLKLKSSAAMDESLTWSSSSGGFIQNFNALKTPVLNGSLASDERYTTERNIAINYHHEDDSVFENAPFTETNLKKNEGSRKAVVGLNSNGLLGLAAKPWTVSNNSKTLRVAESVLSNFKNQALNDLLTDFSPGEMANSVALTKSKKPLSWYEEKDPSILNSSERHDKSNEDTSVSEQPYSKDISFAQCGKCSVTTHGAGESCVAPARRVVLATSSVQGEGNRRNGCASSADQNHVTPGAVPDIETIVVPGMRRRSEADVRSIADVKKERLLRRMSTLSHENRLEQERLRSARQDLLQHVNTARRQDVFHLELLRNERGLHGGVQETLGWLEGEQGAARRGVERPESGRRRVVYHRATWTPAIRGDPFQHSLHRPPPT